MGEPTGMSNDKRTMIFIGVALVAATIACYWRVLGFEFVNYDDNKYIQMNDVVKQGITTDGIIWAFTTFRLANWHPLTWLSHMLDVQMFELDAGLHHFMNVLIHAANGAILLALLWMMTRDIWRSTLVAGLFALHPLHVESVAWVSERKDVLSTLFGLLCVLMYVRYVRFQRQSQSERSRGAYAWCVVLLAMSLMSKPMLVTMPIVLLLLDWWPLNRVRERSWGGLLFEKLPLFALAAASCVLAVLAQSRGGAVATLDSVTLGARIINAIVAYGTYIRQTLWPVGLSPLYPLPGSWPMMTIVFSAISLCVITTLTLLFARRKPAIFVGWFWFLGTLVPVIGLVQVGSQAHADRYTYVPLIGLFIMFAWAIPDVQAQRSGVIAARKAITILILLACAIGTSIQLGHWRDSIALSQRAIAVTPVNAVAHFNLANALVEKDRNAEAIEHFKQAAAINHTWADIDNNLANALLRLNQTDEAIAAYRSALTKNPIHVYASKTLGVLLAGRGELAEAATLLQSAAVGDPADAVTQMFLGTVLRDLGRPAEAQTAFEQALKLATAQGDQRLAGEIQRRAAAMESAPR